MLLDRLTAGQDWCCNSLLCFFAAVLSLDPGLKCCIAHLIWWPLKPVEWWRHSSQMKAVLPLINWLLWPSDHLSNTGPSPVLYICYRIDWLQVRIDAVIVCCVFAAVLSLDPGLKCCIAHLIWWPLKLVEWWRHSSQMEAVLPLVNWLLWPSDHLSNTGPSPVLYICCRIDRL